MVCSWIVVCCLSNRNSTFSRSLAKCTAWIKNCTERKKQTAYVIPSRIQRLNISLAYCSALLCPTSQASFRMIWRRYLFINGIRYCYFKISFNLGDDILLRYFFAIMFFSIFGDIFFSCGQSNIVISFRYWFLKTVWRHIVFHWTWE